MVVLFSDISLNISHFMPLKKKYMLHITCYIKVDTQL